MSAAGRTTLASVVENALAFQDSREPKYRAPENETARMLVPDRFPTYDDLRTISGLVKALEIGVSDLEFILNELIAVRPGSYRASNTLTEMRAALAAAKTGGAA